MAAPGSGLGLGLGLAVGCRRGAAAGLGGCLAVVLGGGQGSGLGVAAGWGFGRAAGAGVPRVRRSPVCPRADCEAAGALAVAGAPAVGTGLGACLSGAGVGVLDENVVVEVDEVVVVEEMMQSEPEEPEVGYGGGSPVWSEVGGTDVADSRGSRTGGAGAGCWVLWAIRTRVWVRASGVCARFSWSPLCVPVLVLWLVPCLVCGAVLELSWLCGQAGYSGGSTSAPRCVGVPAGGIRAFRRSIAGLRACPLP